MRGGWITMVALAMAMARASLAGPALQTTELGRGSTVVLIHTLGGSRAGWMPTARKLLAKHHVVLVELPGHGESPLPDPFSLDAGAAAIGEVLAAQKGESTVVVGQGMGALMGLMAVAAHPERARGVIGIDMSLESPFAIPPPEREMFVDMMDQTYDYFVRRMFTKLGRDSAQGVAIHAQAAQVPHATMKAYIREMVNLDRSKLPKTFGAPVLFVGTERVWPANYDSAAFAIRMGYPGDVPFRVRRMSNCGYLVASEQPDTLAAIIDGFTRRVLARK